METSKSAPAPVDHDRRWLAVAGASAAVVVTSIVIGTLVGEVPEPVWVLLVPVGMLGAALVCAISLSMAFVARDRR